MGNRTNIRLIRDCWCLQTQSSYVTSYLWRLFSWRKKVKHFWLTVKPARRSHFLQTPMIYYEIRTSFSNKCTFFFLLVFHEFQVFVTPILYGPCACSYVRRLFLAIVTRYTPDRRFPLFNTDPVLKHRTPLTTLSVLRDNWQGNFYEHEKTTGIVTFCYILRGSLSAIYYSTAAVMK